MVENREKLDENSHVRCIILEWETTFYHYTVEVNYMIKMLFSNALLPELIYFTREQ